MVKYTEGRVVGAEVWYICNAGYRLVGTESRRCGSDLHWSGDAPICVGILCTMHHNSMLFFCLLNTMIQYLLLFMLYIAQGCGKPESPDNGRVSYRYTTVGAQAWYYCNSGYTRVGAQSRTCKSNGKWEPELPICQRTRTKITNLNFYHNIIILFSVKTLYRTRV